MIHNTDLIAVLMVTLIRQSYSFVNSFFEMLNFSLMKMVAGFSHQGEELTVEQLNHSINRNFGGFEREKFDPLAIFKSHCEPVIATMQSSDDDRPPSDPIELIESCLSGEHIKFDG